MKSLFSSLLILSAGLTSAAATVDRVIVRQQYPWTETVKVEYVVSGVTNPVDMVVSVDADGTALDADNVRAALKGDVYGIVRNGAGTIEIDPAVAMGVIRASVKKLRVTLSTTASSGNIRDVLYRIFDLNDGTYVDATRADFLNGKYGAYETDFSKIGSGYTTSLEDVFIWTDVTNNPVYKTDKLVMRKINAAGKVWRCGSINGEKMSDEFYGGRTVPVYYVKLTNDYFISVFEMTQAQYAKLGGTTTSAYAGDDAAFHPAENMMYMDILGRPDEWSYSRGVVTQERICWPTNSYIYDTDVRGGDKSGFIGQARPKLGGVEIYLPTHAQWEYACRAGTDTPWHNGRREQRTEINSKEIGWTHLNAGGKTHAVGQLRPNAFGLYDMHGNVAEFVADATVKMDGQQEGHGLTAEDPLVEPVGERDVYTQNGPAKCGGGFGTDFGYYYDGTSFGCSIWYQWSNKTGQLGFRLVAPVNKYWAPHD